MADTKLTGLDADASLTGTELVYVVDDPSGTPASKKTTVGDIKTFVGVPVKATGAEVDTGEDDAKFVTSKAMEDSSYIKTVEGTAVKSTGEEGGTKYLREDGDGTCSWQTVSAGGGTFWNLVVGSPTRAGNTTFTVTGDYTALFVKGFILKWTEDAAVKNAMVVSSSYSDPNTTVTIIGDAMASIDASSLKITYKEPFIQRFAVAGTIGAVVTDVANAYLAIETSRVIGADLNVGTAGTTNATTIDINKAGTTMFTTKPTLASTVAFSPTPFTADSATSLAIGDKVTIDVDAVQTTAAIDLYVYLYLFPTRYNSLT